MFVWVVGEWEIVRRSMCVFVCDWREAFVHAYQKSTGIFNLHAHCTFINIQLMPFKTFYCIGCFFTHVPIRKSNSSWSPFFHLLFNEWAESHKKLENKKKQTYVHVQDNVYKKRDGIWLKMGLKKHIACYQIFDLQMSIVSTVRQMDIFRGLSSMFGHQ